MQERNKFIAATLNVNENPNPIDCYMNTYIDTASSCHCLASLELLDEGTVQHANETVRTANGNLV